MVGSTKGLFVCFLSKRPVELATDHVDAAAFRKTTHKQDVLLLAAHLLANVVVEQLVVCVCMFTCVHA